MSEKRSTLNPLASSFVPGKMTETSCVREIADKYVKELIEKKEAKGEKSLSKLEMANLVGQLIFLRFKSSRSKADFSKINSYLSFKILRTETASLKPLTSPIKGSFLPAVKKETFDLSKFQPPTLTFLLVAFWGLYRHEQAQRPLLSLSYRPETVKDKIWSLDSSDKRLWNASCVENVCGCPPMFGYIIPSSFFGNLSHLEYTCQEQSIHLTHYPESAEGNEFILTNNFNYNTLDQELFNDDFESAVSVQVATCGHNVDNLKAQFETTMAGLCDLLPKYDDSTEITTEVCETVDEKDDEDHGIYFWDNGCDLEHSRIPFAEQTKEDLVDDNEHPLLEAQNFEDEEGVSLEIEEMIRRSLSPKKDSLSFATDIAFEDVEVTKKYQDFICDPPCSVWCDSASAASEEMEQTIHIEVKLTPNPETPNEDAPKIDLLSREQLDSQSEPKTGNTYAIDLKPALKFHGNRIMKPVYRRSFSVNDCDPYYYDAKFGFNGTMAQVSNSLSSKDMLTFLRKDPVNFFKSFNRSDSWKDTDSGFVSQWSSQDDLLGDRSDCYRDQDDKGSMWGLFSGEDSLWKPLPECAAPNGNDKPFPHRRVRDLRRQRSLS